VPETSGAVQPSITVEDIAAAEKVIGLSFTEREREQMLETVAERTESIVKAHAVRLDNAVAPPLYFDPRPAAQIAPQTDDPAQRAYPQSAPTPVTRPANLEDAAFYPLTQLAELVRTRQVTSLELTEMYLARLKRYNEHLHCVVTFTEDLAYAQAKRADAEIAAGHYRSPLHGIPWGAKDLLAVKGYPTTWGAEPYRNQVIDLDATVVQRLEAAGAVLIAKLTLGALAYGDIWFGGTTCNPWNLEEGSSGSSAGSGSAVAAGLVGFAIGTETLGSIVSPSTRCGVTGLRPTFGRVSRYGAMALCWSMDKIGPMARSVEDCALIFNAIYGADGLDASVIHAPFAWEPERDPRRLRVGYVARAFEEGTENDRAVLDALRGLGIDLIPIALPDDDLDPLGTILITEAAAAFDEITRENLDDTLTWQEKEAWPNGFRAARLIPAVEYIQANRIRTLLMQKMAAVMQTVDVFVSPPFGGNTLVLTNYTGHPAVVLPNGFRENGSPTSVTFVSNLYREADALTLAKAYQDATDFHRQHPPMQYAAGV
jgi:Asp-tRNA(Asn)/Glu-tRNA(Gln) amidotransferase A subunit family amidase